MRADSQGFRCHGHGFFPCGTNYKCHRIVLKSNSGNLRRVLSSGHHLCGRTDLHWNRYCMTRNKYTMNARALSKLIRRSGESRNPEHCKHSDPWISAFVGMTVRGERRPSGTLKRPWMNGLMGCLILIILACGGHTDRLPNSTPSHAVPETAATPAADPNADFYKIPTVATPPSGAYREMLSPIVRASLEYESASSRYVAIIWHRQYNPCSSYAGHEIVWLPGKVEIYVRDFVPEVAGGCPVGKIQYFENSVTLRNLTDGDAILLNDHPWINDIGIPCERHRYGNCPESCTRRCAASFCITGGPCTTDCSGPGSCITPDYVGGYDRSR